MRKVQFFDRKSVPVAAAVQALLKRMTTAASSPDGSVWIGTSRGELARLDAACQLVCSLQAFPVNQPVVDLRSCKQAVVALGRIADDGSARICAYHLYRTGPDGPVLIGSTRVPPELAATSIDVTADFQYIAAGCRFGHTLVYSSATFGKPGVKPTILLPDSPVAVSAVRFLHAKKGPVLFIVTEREVTSALVSDGGVEILNVDSSVTPLVGNKELVTVAPHFLGQLYVATQEAVYGFSPEQGNVSAVSWLDTSDQVHLIDAWRQFILLFHRQVSIIAAYPSAAAGSFLNVASVPLIGELLGVATGAFDGHSVVLFTQAVPNGDVNITTLREKPVMDQIDILIDKALFQNAIDLAKYSELPKERMAEIYRKFADFQFEKSEFDKAVHTYTQTLDLGLPLESSYVINKFLLHGKTKHCSTYLERMHAKLPAGAPQVTKDHTALLMLCYQTLGEPERIKTTISQLASETVLDLMHSCPSIATYITTEDLRRICETKPQTTRHVLESLLVEQKFEEFKNLIDNLENVPQDVYESSIVKSAIVEAGITAGIDHSLKTHIDYCKSGQVPPIVMGDDVTGATLQLMLELTLRCKGNSKDIVRAMINQGLGKEALLMCKLFGAPASVILMIAAALNAPIEALAYPAMPLADVCKSLPGGQAMTLNALAVQKRSGQTTSEIRVSNSEKISTALLLETVDTGSEFGSIKGALLSDLQALEESITESTQRATNDATEVSRMKAEMQMMRKRPIVHRMGRPCALCQVPLTELPVTFFRCMHGYHQHCASLDCKLCLTESQHHREILSQRKQSVANHDELFKKMEGGNRFKVAMAYLGHGLFSS